MIEITNDDVRIWKVRQSKLPAADVNGCIHGTGCVGGDGYLRTWINGRLLLAHRIAYVSANGSIPKNMQIDHMCHNRWCAAPEHLRAVTNQQNAENLSGPNCRSTTGVRGVYWYESRNKYRVRVMFNQKPHSGGYFVSLEEAERAAIALRSKLFTHNEIDRRSLETL